MGARHGVAKRVAVVAAIVQREGWKAQVTAADQGGPANAPHLTMDGSMLLVGEALRAAGNTRACTQEDVSAAFDWLTNPMIAAASRAESSIIITQGPA